MNTIINHIPPVCALLTLILSAILVSKHSCDSSPEKKIDNTMYMMAIVILVLWIISAIIYYRQSMHLFSNDINSFMKSDMFMYVCISMVGSLVLPMLVISEHNSGLFRINSDMNNIAMVGLLTNIIILLNYFQKYA